MFGDGSLTFREFLTGEPLPLARIHEAVLVFMQGRGDAALFGAQAVNAYVDEPRMTQGIDILSTRSGELAEELRVYLAERFRIAVWVRKVARGGGLRLYQVRRPKNRHLVDVRHVERLPPCNRLGELLVPAPPVLICSKTLSLVARPKSPKAMTDMADLRRLLLSFPDLKTFEGPVHSALRCVEAPPEAFALWRDLISEEISAEGEEAGL